MKYNDFVKELKKQGVIFDERKGHTKLYLNGKQSEASCICVGKT